MNKLILIVAVIVLAACNKEEDTPEPRVVEVQEYSKCGILVEIPEKKHHAFGVRNEVTGRVGYFYIEEGNLADFYDPGYLALDTMKLGERVCFQSTQNW